MNAKQARKLTNKANKRIRFSFSPQYKTMIQDVSNRGGNHIVIDLPTEGSIHMFREYGYTVERVEIDNGPQSFFGKHRAIIVSW